MCLYKIMSLDEDGVKDRAYRIRHNEGQKRVDQVHKRGSRRPRDPLLRVRALHGESHNRSHRSLPRSGDVLVQWLEALWCAPTGLESSWPGLAPGLRSGSSRMSSHIDPRKTK